jgi:adenylate cyclase
LDAPKVNSFRLKYDLRGRPEIAEFHQPHVVLGRSPDCDLVVPARDVSRFQAAIDRDDEGWVIVDLNSRYGTFVNEEQISSRRLHHGDRIVLGAGTTAITFENAPSTSPDEGRVSFDSGLEHNNIRLTIGVEDLDRAMAEKLGVRLPAKVPDAAAEDKQGGAPEAHADAAGQAPLPIVGLFKQIGEVLLASEDLEDMLGKVLNVAMGCFPAQRGLICLCDETAENVVPKAARTKGLAEGESINISRSIAREAIRSKQALLVDDAPADQRFALAASIVTMDVRAAMCAPLYHAGRVEGLIYVDTRDVGNPFLARDLELLAAMGALTAVGIVQSRLRDEVHREKAITSRLSRYSSPRVVEQIVAGVNSPDGSMMAVQREVTVLFADLSGFTSLAESHEPVEVVRMLNCVFEQMTRAIFQFDGTLDKFLGDGVLAVFGAPVTQVDHAERAVHAALLMRQLLGECQLVDAGGQPVSMRIGINSGTAVAGDIGSPVRKDYTVVGDAVNVASRLQSSVAMPGQIVIGPATHELCKRTFECEPLPEIRLKGKQQPVSPYLVVRHRADTRI